MNTEELYCVSMSGFPSIDYKGIKKKIKCCNDEDLIKIRRKNRKYQKLFKIVFLKSHLNTFCEPDQVFLSDDDLSDDDLSPKQEDLPSKQEDFKLRFRKFTDNYKRVIETKRKSLVYDEFSDYNEEGEFLNNVEDEAEQIIYTYKSLRKIRQMIKNRIRSRVVKSARK